MGGAALTVHPKTYVHLLHGQDTGSCRAAFDQGKVPEKTPYGFHRAAGHGFDLHFSRDRPMAGGWLARVIRRIVGFNVLHALGNLGRVRRCDMVWTMTEGEALAVAMLFALRLAPSRPIVGNIIWLMNEWDRQSGLRRWLYRRLARHISVWTVHSRQCLEPARRCFPGNDVRLVYFGVNDDMFTPALREARSDGPIRIFAAGNDRTRDWPTLLDAFGNDPRFAVKLACAWIGPEDLAGFNNVERASAHSMADFLRLYRWADCVAVPMRDNLFSGITVALEAAAMGIAIVSSRTGGVPTYFGEQDILYADAGEAAAMREAVGRLSRADLAAWGDRARSAFLRGDFTTAALARQYAAIAYEIWDGSAGKGGKAAGRPS
jgi:glycosyltransferase involved in cell wall biosynthesis